MRCTIFCVVVFSIVCGQFAYAGTYRLKTELVPSDPLLLDRGDNDKSFGIGETRKPRTVIQRRRRSNLLKFSHDITSMVDAFRMQPIPIERINGVDHVLPVSKYNFRDVPKVGTSMYCQIRAEVEDFNKIKDKSLRVLYETMDRIMTSHKNAMLIELELINTFVNHGRDLKMTNFTYLYTRGIVDLKSEIVMTIVFDKLPSSQHFMLNKLGLIKRLRQKLVPRIEQFFKDIEQQKSVMLIKNHVKANGIAKNLKWLQKENNQWLANANHPSRKFKIPDKPLY